MVSTSTPCGIHRISLHLMTDYVFLPLNFPLYLLDSTNPISSGGMSLPTSSRLQMGNKVYSILERIPEDRWIPSRELSETVGLDSKIVSAIIRSQLLYKYVIRRELPKNSDKGGFEYRRRAIF